MDILGFQNVHNLDDGQDSKFLGGAAKEDCSLSDAGSVDEAPTSGDNVSSDSEWKPGTDSHADTDSLGGDFPRTRIALFENEIRALELLKSRVACPRTAAGLDEQVVRSKIEV